VNWCCWFWLQPSLAPLLALPWADPGFGLIIALLLPITAMTFYHRFKYLILSFVSSVLSSAV